jgi:hypothetical protein
MYVLDVAKDLWFDENVIDVMAVVDKLAEICLEIKTVGDQTVRIKNDSKTVMRWIGGEAQAVGYKTMRR